MAAWSRFRFNAAIERAGRWHLADRSATPCTGPLEPVFAREDAWLEAIGSGQSQPVLHLWRHQRAVVLGYRDTRLPRWQEAAGALAAEGYQVAVRPSGGTAVPLDAGVLNVSLLYPAAGLQIQDGFDAMATLLGLALRPLGLEAVRGLVPGGYCPGDSDLAVGGRKVAGISQRRRLRATLVHAFLIVEGSGAGRGQVAARFYALAAPGLRPGPPGKGPYPDVQPQAMQSLEEAAGRPVTVGQVVAVMRSLLES